MKEVVPVFVLESQPQEELGGSTNMCDHYNATDPLENKTATFLHTEKGGAIIGNSFGKGIRMQPRQPKKAV